MKELTTEQKAQRYNEAIEKAKTYYNKSTCLRNTLETLENIFPELSDSEDERIRKSIISGMKALQKGRYTRFANIPVNNVIAWLEKQSETMEINPTEFDTRLQALIGKFDTLPKEELIGSLSFWLNVVQNDGTYKVDMPRFHEGDWVTNGVCTFKIASIENGFYCDTNNCGRDIESIDRSYHLWTIQDAKDGDVLSDGTTIFIFKDLLSDGSVMSYCDYDTDSGESDAFCPLLVNLMCSKITPATKEQRDTLMKSMADAGYTFDFEKKEVGKIKQKPAWSEEDEGRLKSCLRLLKPRDSIVGATETVNTKWLKSLKERIKNNSL